MCQGDREKRLPRRLLRDGAAVVPVAVSGEGDNAPSGDGVVQP